MTGWRQLFAGDRREHEVLHGSSSECAGSTCSSAVVVGVWTMLILCQGIIYESALTSGAPSCLGICKTRRLKCRTRPRGPGSLVLRMPPTGGESVVSGRRQLFGGDLHQNEILCHRVILLRNVRADHSSAGREDCGPILSGCQGESKSLISRAEPAGGSLRFTAPPPARCRLTAACVRFGRRRRGCAPYPSGPRAGRPPRARR